MKTLLKKTIWLVIYLLPLLAIIYYRAFLFTADFNQPVDNALQSASEKAGFTIPSYQLGYNEQSLYDKYISRSATDQNVNATPNQYTQTDYSNHQLQHQHNEPVSNDNDAGIQYQGYTYETTETADQSNVSAAPEKADEMEKIITAVKDTVSETLETFMQDNEQDAADSITILSAKELLFKARLAYWNGDLKTAESTYIQLTEVVDSDPNAYGELGNLYYMQAKWKLASDAYYHAALKLKNNDNLYQAQHLLRIIRGLDSETADKLQAELGQTS